MDQRILKLFQELDELDKEYKQKIMEQIVFQREIPCDFDGINSWMAVYFLAESCIDDGVPECPHMIRIQTTNGLFNMPSKQRKEHLEIVIKDVAKMYAWKKLRMDERLEEIQRGENNDQN